MRSNGHTGNSDLSRCGHCFGMTQRRLHAIVYTSNGARTRVACASARAPIQCAPQQQCPVWCTSELNIVPFVLKRTLRVSVKRWFVSVQAIVLHMCAIKRAHVQRGGNRDRCTLCLCVRRRPKRSFDRTVTQKRCTSERASERFARRPPVELESAAADSIVLPPYLWPVLATRPSRDRGLSFVLCL